MRSVSRRGRAVERAVRDMASTLLEAHRSRPQGSRGRRKRRVVGKPRGRDEHPLPRRGPPHSHLTDVRDTSAGNRKLGQRAVAAPLRRLLLLLLLGLRGIRRAVASRCSLERVGAHSAESSPTREWFGRVLGVQDDGTVEGTMIVATRVQRRENRMRDAPCTTRLSARRRRQVRAVQTPPRSCLVQRSSAVAQRGADHRPDVRPRFPRRYARRHSRSAVSLLRGRRRVTSR